MAGGCARSLALGRAMRGGGDLRQCRAGQHRRARPQVSQPIGRRRRRIVRLCLRALAFVLLERANVRVDALYIRLPKPVTALLDLLALLMLGVFVLLLGWFAGKVLEDSLLFATRANTPLGTPLWIPQSLWLLGFGLFLFAWLPLVLRVALALLSGDLAQVRALAGARTLQEEAAAEVAHTADIEQVAIEGPR
jgi:TRAP-type C4-dicarboxylate transport system permease small subunit